jgi:hypothetical protein
MALPPARPHLYNLAGSLIGMQVRRSITAETAALKRIL